jgi:alkanesulfonate monooxygenase SsuD/methylene tetrahydromethanopterin reductase-like flavin-dependent oxidoreductase (luciferase family)
MAGRGSFTESFPLFGQDLADYDELFAEKLDLLLRLRESENITWSGRHRPPLDDRGVYPRPVQDRCPSGSRSAARRRRWCAPQHSGCPWRSPSSAGAPARFVPMVELYREAAARAGHDPASLPVSINSTGSSRRTQKRPPGLRSLRLPRS